VITLSNNKALGATYATAWVDCRRARRVHFQWSSDNTSSPVGVVSIEESNDPLALADYLSTSNAETTSSTAKTINISGDTTRVKDVGTSFTVNAANETVVTVVNPAAFVRVKYTRTSGGATAVANCWAHAVE
jgi:hypothetical protein